MKSFSACCLTPSVVSLAFGWCFHLCRRSVGWDWRCPLPCLLNSHLPVCTHSNLIKTFSHFPISSTSPIFYFFPISLIFMYSFPTSSGLPDLLLIPQTPSIYPIFSPNPCNFPDLLIFFRNFLWFTWYILLFPNFLSFPQSSVFPDLKPLQHFIHLSFIPIPINVLTEFSCLSLRL